MKHVIAFVVMVTVGFSSTVWAAQEGAARRGGAQARQKTGFTSIRIELPPHKYATALLPDSPFGINNGLAGRPMAVIERHLRGFQEAGIKWGRQDFTWRSIETAPGVYNWETYDALVDACRAHGQLIFGNFAYGPAWRDRQGNVIEQWKDYDPGTPEGVAKYAAFAAAAAARYKGKVDHWQIWNEPNGGFFYNYGPEKYAALLAAAGKAIKQANPDAKVLALNSAFCDVLFAERVLSRVPPDAYDIICFHPYRVMCAPEEKFDWWQLDQYVKAWKSVGLDGKPLDENWPLIRMSMLEQTDEMIKVMEKYGPRKPIWITEICWNTNIHPYGTPELRQADMIVRLHVLCIASQKIQKIFWWTFMDGQNERQYDMGDMVGLVRPDYEPKYSFYAFAFMTRMLEGKKWIGNFSFGNDQIYTCVFRDEQAGEDTIVAWATRPYAYIKVTNTERGLTFYDVFGTRRFVPLDPPRTNDLTVPLGESPIYIVAPAGVRARNRPDPGW